MAQYRVVYSTPTSGGATAEFVEAPSMFEAIETLHRRHADASVISASLFTRDPEPSPPTRADLVVSLTKALIGCYSVLKALSENSIFQGALSPERRRSLAEVLDQAQRALDMAGVRR